MGFHLLHLKAELKKKKKKFAGTKLFPSVKAGAHSSDQCFLCEWLEQQGPGRSFGEYFIREERPLCGLRGGGREREKGESEKQAEHWEPFSLWSLFYEWVLNVRFPDQPKWSGDGVLSVRLPFNDIGSKNLINNALFFEISLILVNLSHCTKWFWSKDIIFNGLC